MVDFGEDLYDQIPWNITLAACVICIIALVFWNFVIRPHREAIPPFDDIPCLPNNHWLFGHVFLLISRQFPDFVTQQKTLYEKYADPKTGRTGFWLPNSCRGIILTQAADIRAVLQKECHKSAPLPALYHLQKLLGPEQLGLLNGPKWKAHRAAITKSFNPSALRALQAAVRQTLQTTVHSLTNRILQQSRQQQQNIKNKNGYVVFDIAILMKLIGIDTLGLSALSFPFHCCKTLQLHEFAESFEFVMGDVFRRIEDQPWRPDNILYCLPTASNRRFQMHANRVRSLVRTIVQERRREEQHQQNGHVEKGSSNKDLLDNLLAAHEDAKGKNSRSNSPKQNHEITDETLIDVALTILFAGYDTVSNTLTYALFLISQHESVQDKLLQEIHQVMVTSDAGKGDETIANKINPEDLVYTKACFDEALRLYPPGAVGNFRNLQRPITLKNSNNNYSDGDISTGKNIDGLTLPKGTYVLFPFWTAHRNPSNFQRPLEFVPERWVRQDKGSGRWVERGGRNKDSAPDDNMEIDPADRDNFFGFSAGGRNCPGGRYATQEGILVLATLLHHFSFEPDDDQYRLVPERHGPVQRPQGGIPMKIRLRQS